MDTRRDASRQAISIIHKGCLAQVRTSQVSDFGRFVLYCAKVHIIYMYVFCHEREHASEQITSAEGMVYFPAAMSASFAH